MNLRQIRGLLSRNDARLERNKKMQCYYIDRVKPYFVPSSFYYTMQGLLLLTKDELLSKIPEARLL